MSYPKGSKDDSSKKNGGFVYAVGFQSQIRSSLTRNSGWIINTGVIDHRTYNRYKFDQLSSKCPINIVTNAYGVSSPIFGISNVPLSPSLTLNDVLFVLSLNFNFISIKQLIKSHNLSCTYFPTHFIL